jgi:hypothetical protein
MALLRSGTRIYGNATIDTVLDIDGQDAATSNVTGALKIAGGIGVKGNVFSSGNITALNANLGNLVIANYVTGTLTTNAQPNITSVGSLTSLTVTGSLAGNNATFSGNLIVNGSLVYANVSTLNIKDPIIEQGGGVDGTALATNDLKDRGQLLHYYTTAPVDAFMGWDNSNAEFAFGSNVTVSSEIITFTTFGNVRANNFLGNLSGSAGTVTTNAQPNITSVGTLLNTTMGGANSLSGGNLVSATYLSGTITTNAQPNITSLGTLTGLNVLGSSNLGPPANVRITGGTNGYVLITDGNGNLSWAAGASGSGNANVAGSNTQIQYNDGTNLAGSANLTFNNTSNTLTVDKITVTDLSVTGNVTSNLIPSVDSTYDLGSSSRKFKDLYLSGNSLHLSDVTVTANNGNLSLPNTVFSGKTFVSNVSNLNISGGTSGYILSTDGSGNLNWVSAGNALQASGGISIVSNIANLVAGSAIDISVSYADADFPGGKYTIAQLGPVSLSATDVWYTGSTSKNAYANFIAGTVNTQNVNVTFSLANATFNVQSSDYINIGSSNVTGANLVALNITANGTYTIPSGYLTAANTQTNSTVAVNASITTSRGVFTSTGTTLTNNQPVPFNVTVLSGSFGSATVPYFSLNQTFSWNATTTSGATVASGNVTYSIQAVGSATTLTSVGATSGTSPSLDSTTNYTITSSDYFGAGAFGAGSRTMTATVNGTVTAATKYYPLFYQITSSNAVPAFTTSTTRLTSNVIVGTSATTSATPSYYLWMATPSTNTGVLSGANRTFKHVFLGSDIVDTPDVASETTISGQSYNIYGFTNFSVATPILVTG